MKKVRTQVMLDKNIKDELFLYAEEQNISFGSVVRDALITYIQTKKAKLISKKPADATKFLLQSQRKIQFKGPKDLSTTVDKQVYGL